MSLSKKEITEIEKIIGYKFDDKDLILPAFVNPSYVDKNESEKKKLLNRDHLELIGDTILNTYITLNICDFNIKFSVIAQKKSSLISNAVFNNVVKELGLDKYRKTNNKNVGIKEGGNLLERLIGGIYSDSNESTAKKIIKKKIFPLLLKKDEPNYIGMVEEYFTSKKMKIRNFAITNKGNLFGAKIIIDDNRYSVTNRFTSKKIAKLNLYKRLCIKFKLPRCKSTKL